MNQPTAQQPYFTSAIAGHHVMAQRRHEGPGGTVCWLTSSYLICVWIEGEEILASPSPDLEQGNHYVVARIQDPATRRAELVALLRMIAGDEDKTEDEDKKE